MSFKIKRKLHPKFPDYIPALKIAGVEGDLVESIMYNYHHDTPIATVRFKGLTYTRRAVRAYKYNGNTWVVMGSEYV
jgi:hypothetical protein